MTDHGITMTDWSIQRYKAGQKWMTRRLLKDQPPDWLTANRVPDEVPGMPGMWAWWSVVGTARAAQMEDVVRCPYGQVGDRLVFRERWKPLERPDGTDGIEYLGGKFIPIENTPEAAERWVVARGNREGWRNPLFMPWWAARFKPTLLEVRIERLQEITEVDALAEGCVSIWAYQDKWNEINRKRAPWSSDPFVWTLTFERYK